MRKLKRRGLLAFSMIFFDLLKLTIFLLILLAILSIIGTLITQNATSGEYIQRYGANLYEVLDFFGLFDMYHSWWFSAILLLLVTNLIACSAERFPGVWNQMLRGVGPEGLSEFLAQNPPLCGKTEGKRGKEGSDRRGCSVLTLEGFPNMEAGGD